MYDEISNMGTAHVGSFPMSIQYITLVHLLVYTITFKLFINSADVFKHTECEFVSLKVVSAILGRNINDHIHLIFPHDPLAAGRQNNTSLSAACAQRSYTKKNGTTNQSKLK